MDVNKRRSKRAAPQRETHTQDVADFFLWKISKEEGV
jgi:hypothetical protein